MTQKILPGVAELSIELHEFISSLVFKNDEKTNLERPFETIGYAFSFAFSLGYIKNGREKVRSPKKDISVRGFRPESFKILIETECNSESLSLGALISEYAEFGSKEMQKHLEAGGNILQLLDETG